MIIRNALKEGREKLQMNNINSSLLDSEILISKAIRKDRKFVILNLDQEIKKKNYDYFYELINERARGKPIAYLIGKKDFWKYEFIINENVLVPRPDTEIIVDKVLKIFKNKSKINFLDIGVGSGCILLSILREKKNFMGTGIDLSKESLEICKINADKLGVKNRTKLIKSDIDNFVYGKYDLIISNPPYIKKLDLKYLDRDVTNFEPKLALDGGLDGLSEIRKVVNKSCELIKRKGKLILEIAFDQKYETKELLRKNGFYINCVIKDFAKNDRCIVSTKI